MDFPDFLQFVGKFGARQGDAKYEDRFDLDGDGAIEFSDFPIFVSKFGKTVPLTVDRLNFPLRALHAAGHWGTNETVVYEWEANGRQGSLVPSDYIEWLKGLHVNWVGFMVNLHYDDSMDSTVERDYLTLEGRTFPDDVLRQMIRDFRDHGIKVYLTLALSDYEAGQAAHPAHRWQLGHSDPPYNILPENWPWRPDHPDHQRFVAEFWETYTQQAVHFARIAEDEGARLYSLGTETDRLFRTRSGDSDNPNERDWTNSFGQELKVMVDRVRAVYSGLLTYDMHYSVLLDLEYFGPGSNHLWNENRGDDKGAALPHLNFSPFGGSARGDYFCSRGGSARRGFFYLTRGRARREQLSDVRAIETKRASASTAEWEITQASFNGKSTCTANRS